MALFDASSAASSPSRDGDTFLEECHVLHGRALWSGVPPDAKPDRSRGPGPGRPGQGHARAGPVPGRARTSRRGCSASSPTRSSTSTAAVGSSARCSKGPDADPLADGWVSASTMRQLRDPETDRADAHRRGRGTARARRSCRRSSASPSSSPTWRSSRTMRSPISWAVPSAPS